MTTDIPSGGPIFKRLCQAGGQPYITGGAVRDHLLEKPVRDTDVVVFNMAPDRLVEVLSGFGQVLTYGKSFRVYQVRGLDLQFSLPRSGNDQLSTGEDRGMILDALGRDFTINALYMNPVTGIIKDPLKGLEDLVQKQLRQTSPASFVQDPLRILRAVQLAARLGFDLAPDTREAMKKVTLEKVASERVYEELCKWLMTSAPGRGWELLRETGHVPEMCFQSAATVTFHHFPADWDHVMADILNRGGGISNASSQPLPYMWGLLLFGCALAERRSTKRWPDTEWHRNTIKAFRKRSNNQQHTQALSALLWGLVHFQDLSRRGSDVARLSLRCNLGELNLAIKSLTPWWHYWGVLKPVLKAANRMDQLSPSKKIEPLVTGSDLKQWGYKEGREMGLLLEIAFQMQLEGVPRETIEDYFKKQRVLLEKAGRLG